MAIHDDSDDGLITGEEQCYKDNSPLNDILIQKSVSKDEKQKEGDGQNECKAKVKNWKSCCAFLKTLTLEPFLTLHMFAYIARTVCNQNLLIDKSCLYVFYQSPNVCSNLDNYTDEKKQIEKYADNYNLFVTLMQTLPAVFFAMVIGPWSDKYGRILPIILAIIGGIIENVGTILNVVYFDAPMYFLLISAIPAGITGGLICTILCIYSLASEQSSQKQRTIKYALLELAFGIGSPLGTFIGGLLYKKYGYLSVYILSLSLQVVSLLWVIFIIKDTKSNGVKLKWSIVRDLFCFDSFKESFHTITKPRENNVKKEIWLLVGSMCMLISTLIATSGFAYFFAKWMYNFDVTFYSNVNTVFISCGMLFSVIAVVFSSRVLKLQNPDGIYGIVGSISTLLANVLKAFAFKPWIYYIAGSSGVFGGLGLLAVRSRLSKIVEIEEIGKVFAFLASCESLTPVLGSVLFTQIFNASIDVFPGLAYFVAGVLTTLPLGTFIWITLRTRKPYQQLPDQSENSPSEKRE